ncbi:MAB_1171c family putative transporter [Streptomyces sp. NPDC001288]|uniref:MAB_1171c family putative transporter n=1 Tax=unclassified Streptomyces TaxID=2593676 RepID=UPI00332BF88D
MADALALLGALALISFGLWRRAALYEEAPTPGLRQAHRFALCLGAALLVLAPASALHLERTVALPGLPMLLGDVMRMLAVSFLGLLTDGRPSRRWTVTASALIALPVLFIGAHPHQGGGWLTVDGPHRPVLAGYDTVLVAYPAWQLTALLRTLRRRARVTDAGPPLTALRLLQAAVAVGLAWTAWGLDDVRLALLTGRHTDGDDTVSAVLGLLCTLLTVSGGSAAAWPGIRHWRWCLSTYRALGPLWSALNRAFPDTALPYRRHPLGLAAPGRLRFALHRRVIEIHDGLLLLRPRLARDAGCGEAVHISAAGIASALRTPAPPEHSPTGRLRLGDATGTDAAASKLAEVSRAFAGLRHPKHPVSSDVQDPFDATIEIQKARKAAEAQRGSL